MVVGRDLSVKAVEYALKRNKEVFVTAQKKVDTEKPTASDIYHSGTRATILQVARMPNGNLKILIEGIVRSRIVQVTQEKGFIGVIAQDTVSVPLESSSKSKGRLSSSFCKGFSTLWTKVRGVSRVNSFSSFSGISAMISLRWI